MTNVKQIKKYFTGIVLLPSLFFSYAFVNANTTMENNLFVISTGSELIECSLQNNKFKITNYLLRADKWENAVWPIYNEQTRQVFFEAQNDDLKRTSQIFSYHITSEKLIPEPIIEGRYPSVSPTGSLLVYYRHPNQLWVLDIKTKKKTKLLSNYLKRNPAVWISNHEILYTNTDNRLYRIHIFSGLTTDTGIQKVIPGAVSSDLDQVLCGSYDGKKIYLYSVETNTIKVLKKSLFLSMGSSFVWFADGKHFLYTRQTFANQIKLDESYSLFYSSTDMKEQKLVDKFSLFGGFSR